MNPSKNLTGASIIAIAAFLVFAWLYPNYQKIITARETVTVREETLAERASIIETIENLSKEYRKHSSEVAKFSQVLPDKKNLAELISSIETMAQRSGVLLSEFQIGDPKVPRQTRRTML